MSGKPARLASLASRFVGAAGGVHVVDPCPDLRQVFQQPGVLEQNVHLRLRPSSNIQKLREDYGRWWQSYESFLKGEAPKSELRNGVKAFLEALALPNELDAKNTSVDCSFTEMHTRAAEATESSLRTVLRLSPPGFSGRSVPALRLLQSDLWSLFSSSQLISPPNFCRAALIEAVNWNPEEYLTFSSGDCSSHKDTLFLMGVSLPSLLAPFIRARFTKTNIFPITLQAAGVSYHNSPPDCRARTTKAQHRCILPEWRGVSCLGFFSLGCSARVSSEETRFGDDGETSASPFSVSERARSHLYPSRGRANHFSLLLLRPIPLQTTQYFRGRHSGDRAGGRCIYGNRHLRIAGRSLQHRHSFRFSSLNHVEKAASFFCTNDRSRRGD